ncbi:MULTISPECIES: Imm1 family immunity protein [unclassified Streptomyces]|uniref:Imm1 family immunity protein n=1 Tax=unclassified Streptomyces TaxID=2593676 RepID=UPI002FC72F59
MILNAIIHGRYQYADDWNGKSALITEVLENLQHEDRSGPWISAGETASFMFAERRHSETVRDWWPDNCLQVAVNSESGYGGLVWSANQDRITRDEISEHIWVSDNPNPPDFDPRVVSDPGVPYFFDPRSTLPVNQIRAALEEFCRNESGNRPECVAWVHGELNGERHS